MAFTVSVCLRVLRLLGQFSPSPTDMSVLHLFHPPASVKIPRLPKKERYINIPLVALNLFWFSRDISCPFWASSYDLTLLIDMYYYYQVFQNRPNNDFTMET